MVTGLKDEERGENKRPASVAGLPISVIRWGFIFFVAASVAGFVIAFIISEDRTIGLESFRRFNPIWFIPAAVLMVLDWAGAGLRFKALTSVQDRRISYYQCFQIGTAGAGIGYLTPSATGSGATNIYGVMRQGLTFGRAAAVNAMSFLTNVIFLSIAGLSAWALGFTGAIADVRLPVGNLSAAALFNWSTAVFVTGVALIVTLALVPGVARALIRRTMGSEHPRSERVLHHFDELHDGLLAYWRDGKLAFLAAVASGAIQFGSRFILGWVVLKGFVADAPLVEVALIHMVIQYLLFVIPTPGGAGVGEVITAVVMAPFLPAGLVVPYVAVWRVFLTYGTVAMGTYFLFGWLGKDGKR